jgi:AcrR family transcriptional regulator
MMYNMHYSLLDLNIGGIQMPRGNFRTFDTDAALDRALEVFWERGYEGSSLTALTNAIGISRPSLYAAFGNKEELFQKVLDRYEIGPMMFRTYAMQEPTARAVAERLLHGTIENITNEKTPKGCLFVQAALSCGEESEDIRKELISRRASTEYALSKRFEQAVVEGDLPPHTDSDRLARYVTTIQHGLSVQATSGSTRDELLEVVDMAMMAWPK